MADILAQIIDHKRCEVAAAKQDVSIAQLQQQIAQAEVPRNFFAALTSPRHHPRGAPGVPGVPGVPGALRVIAEVKKASPSAGVIREDFDPAAIARAYYENGAAAISCLTDQKYFQGRLKHLGQIRQAVPLPVLRKDFLIDPYQLYESRAAGADAVLLIAECLGEAELIDMLILSTELKMTTLIEVHSVESLLKVRPHIGFPHPGYSLLGINNRDLKSMTTDLSHTLRLLDMVENPDILVSESGIRSHKDVQRLQQAGVHRILVGEHLLRQPDAGSALRQLINGPDTHSSTT